MGAYFRGQYSQTLTQTQMQYIYRITLGKFWSILSTVQQS